MEEKKKTASSRKSRIHSSLDNCFEVYENGQFPSDEELTEWQLR